MQYLCLLRGINVGGKNKVSMTELRQHLQAAGMNNVKTYINSGNVFFDSDSIDTTQQEARIEKLLVDNFELDSELIKVLLVSKTELTSIIQSAPAGFGTQPDKYHSDVVFLIHIDTKEAMSVFKPREGVDRIWPGKGVIYSERLSAERTKSRLSRIVGTPAYKSMTIRSWSTTTKLLTLFN